MYLKISRGRSTRPSELDWMSDNASLSDIQSNAFTFIPYGLGTATTGRRVYEHDYHPVIKIYYKLPAKTGFCFP